MPPDILEDARLYVFESLKGRKNISESKHPWRVGWEFAVLHSLRVESYVTKILARESHPLPERERILLRLAAILHDICRLERREDHAQRGAEVAGKWLQGYAGQPLEAAEIDRVVEWIADHSNKGVREQEFHKAVLKDADTLDEIGLMSVFMAANWVETRSPFFFYDLHQRLIDVELPFCDQKLAILNTRGAREILQEKKAFIESCIAQIADEVELDAHIEQVLLGLSRNTGKLSSG